ncbi:acyl dehydratase [Amorphus suaedae]
MTARYLEDFEVGEAWTSDPFVLSEDDIVRFGREYDPQPMHTDIEAGRNGRFGSVIASGWQVAAMTMRMFVQAGGYGETPMVGLGIDELRWRKVVRAGDELRVVREVIEVRRSQSKPGFGVVRTRVEVRNTDGEVMMSFISAGQVPVRPS